MPVSPLFPSRFLSSCLGLLLLTCASGCSDDPVAPVTEPPFVHLLQANVGNVDPLCNTADYLVNLCRVDVEENLTKNIQALRPDVISLQELVSDAQCDDITEEDEQKVCHPDHRAGEPNQARRLVGPDYTIACDSRNGYECIAVATGFGAIEGCASGDLCLQGATTPGNPEGCDGGFTVSAVEVVPAVGPRFTVVNGHPPSGPETSCRHAQILQIFEGYAEEPPLVGEGPTLLAGDFNLDPFTDIPMGGDDDPSVATWNAYVGEGKRFSYHSGPAEHEPPYPTSLFLIPYVLDHVASDFLAGACTTLGEAPGTLRLDGFDDRRAWEGTDHRALDCRLHLRP